MPDTETGPFPVVTAGGEGVVPDGVTLGDDECGLGVETGAATSCPDVGMLHESTPMWVAPL